MKNIELFYKTKYSNGIFSPLQTAEFIHALKLDLSFYKELERLDYELSNIPRNLTSNEIIIILNCIKTECLLNNTPSPDFDQFYKKIINNNYNLFYNNIFLATISNIEFSRYGYGLLAKLYSQKGARSTDLHLKLDYQGITGGSIIKGSYNDSLTYNKGDIVFIGNKYYKAIADIEINQAPSYFGSNEYWKILIGAQFTQKMFDGNLMTYTLGFNQDWFIRWKSINLDSPTKIITNSTFLDSNVNNSVVPSESYSGSINYTTSAQQKITVTLSSDKVGYFSKELIGTISDTITINSITSVNDNVIYKVHSLISDWETGDTGIFWQSDSKFQIFRVIKKIGNDYHLVYCDGIGTGTIVNPVLYRVRLIYGAVSTSFNFDAYIDSYDASTGETVFNTFRVTGSGNRTPWVFEEGKGQPIIGSSQGRAIATVLGRSRGCAVVGKYYGTGITHRCLTRSGGIQWRYFIVDGEDEGKEFTVDTYNATQTESNLVVAAAGTLKFPGENGATFIMISENSPQSTEQTHAQINYTSNTSLINGIRSTIKKESLNTVMTIAGGGDSSGEYAYRFEGDSSSAWFPDHSGIQIAKDGTYVYKVNGEELDIDTIIGNPYFFEFKSITEFTLEQNLLLYHPDVTGIAGKLKCTHILNRNGMYYKLEFSDFTSELNNEIGYKNMIVFADAFLQKWKAESGKIITRTEGSTSNITMNNAYERTYLGYSDKTTSYYKDYALGIDWGQDYIEQSRKEKSDNGVPIIGYSSNPKIYPTTFIDSNIIEEELSVSATIYAGYYENVNLNN